MVCGRARNVEGGCVLETTDANNMGSTHLRRRGFRSRRKAGAGYEATNRGTVGREGTGAFAWRHALGSRHSLTADRKPRKWR